MALLEAISGAVAELAAYAAGRATGRVFKLEPKRAERIGEYILILVVVLAGLIVTLVYS